MSALMKIGSIVIGALAFAGCRGYESESPPVHPVPNMDTQERGKAYRQDTTGLFADGRVSRAPVEGTVAVGQLGDDLRLDEGLDEEGLPSLKFPDAVKEDGQITDALRHRGQQRYAIYCAPCHGVDLDGKGVMTLPAYDSNTRLVVPPPSFLSKRLKNMPVGQMYTAIKYGVNDGNMGPYAAQIPVRDRWAIIAFIRQQQVAKDPNVDPEGGKVMVVAAVDTASAEHGSQLYEAKGCVTCHSLDGAKLVGPSFQGLVGRTEQTSDGEVVVDSAYLHESIKEPLAKVVNGYPPAMPKLVLTDIEIDSLVLFIESVK